ncbi:MAG: MFS transporter, partial [Halobacteriales archaeon]|nr:MFS transporter [Halobacteriales archaeon]
HPLVLRAAQPWTRGLSGLDRRVALVGASSFLFLGARMGLLTFLGVYLTTRVGLALPVVGGAFLLENIVRAGVAPLGGALSDRIGRKRVMAGSALASMAVMPCFLLVRDAPGLFAWSALAGLAQGAYFPSATALLLDLVPDEARPRALSFHYTALSLGYTVGVLPAGLLAQQGYALLAAESALGFGLVAACVLLGLRRALPREDGAREPLRRASVRPLRDPAFVLLAARSCSPLASACSAWSCPCTRRRAAWPRARSGCCSA